MKTLLNVQMDENGELTLVADYNVPDDEASALKMMEAAMRSLIMQIWKERNTKLSRIIRLLSMAEIAACAEPYSQAEELWTTLMYSFIPHSELICNPLKEQYGFDPKGVTRPIMYTDPAFMMMTKNAQPWFLKES